MRRRLEAWSWLPGLAVATACGAPEISDGPWVSEVSRLVDTTVVATVSGSIWERPARLREELRLGQLEGEGVTAFGSLDYAAVAADGTIFLFDGQTPRLLRFGASGGFLGQVGREGEGPGEYSGRPSGMTVVADRLLLADPGNARLSAYSLDGEYTGSLGTVSGLRSLFGRSLAPARDGGVALRILTIEAGPGELPTPWPIGLEIRAVDGSILDTIPPQSFMGEPAWTTAGLPTGGVLVSTESAFLFELRPSDGAVVRVGMPFEAVAYTPGEVRAMGRMLAPVAAADGEDEVDTPQLKPSYIEFLFGPSGRVFARRPIVDFDDETPTWTAPRYQPSVLDVFEPDGTYLGVLPLPAASRPVVATDTHLFLVEPGEFDEPYFVRYRIDRP